MYKILGKIKTVFIYARLGWRLGYNFSSKTLLSSMLIRIRILDFFYSRSSWGQDLHSAQISLNGSVYDITFRKGDFFIFRDVYDYYANLNSLYEQSPQVIIDLGAHIGLTAILLNSIYPQSTIYCVEPNPRNVQLLQLNKTEKMVIIPKGVSSHQQQTVTFSAEAGRPAGGSIITEHNNNVYEFTAGVVPLDVIIRKAKKQIQMIKFDIEGAEKEVLCGSDLVDKIDFIFGEIKGGKKEIRGLSSCLPTHELSKKEVSDGMYILSFSKR